MQSLNWLTNFWAWTDINIELIDNFWAWTEENAELIFRLKYNGFRATVWRSPGIRAFTSHSILFHYIPVGATSLGENLWASYVLCLSFVTECTFTKQWFRGKSTELLGGCGLLCGSEPTLWYVCFILLSVLSLAMVLRAVYWTAKGLCAPVYRQTVYVLLFGGQGRVPAPGARGRSGKVFLKGWSENILFNRTHRVSLKWLFSQRPEERKTKF